MLANAIIKAKTIPLVEHVLVTSDSCDYLKIAERYGAIPHKRSMHLSDDDIGVDFAVAEVIKEVLQERSLEVGRYVLTLFPCTPLLSESSLTEFVYSFITSGASSGLIVKQYSHPIQRALSIDKDGFITIDSPSYFNCRTQDLPSKYHDTGQAYLTSLELLLSGCLIDKKSYPHIDNYCIDIDNYDDLNLARLIHSRL